MQTNNTLILTDKRFSNLKEKELTFTAKLKEKLTPTTLLIFNGCVLLINYNNKLLLQQKD